MFTNKINFYQCWVIIFELTGWKNASMASASGHNLIDFSPQGKKELGDFPVSGTNCLHNDDSTIQASYLPNIKITQANGNQLSQLSSASSDTFPVAKTGRTNKSLFEITRVESHSGGGDDSEFDDTLSETNESSSTSVLESIKKYSEVEISISENEHVLKPSDLQVTSVDTSIMNITTVSSTISSINTSITMTQSIAHVEAPSRFRIVKIAKSKPYDKGKWVINDYTDSQKHGEGSESSSSPMVVRSRKTSGSGSYDSKPDRIKTISPSGDSSHPKSTEFIPYQGFSSQSRGSSYNTSGVEQRASIGSSLTTVSTTPIVTPMVAALETALDQIQSIKESMVTAVNDEVRKLRDSLNTLKLENNQLREENELLRKRLTIAEERLLALNSGLDKG